MVAFYAGTAEGCRAIEAVLGGGLQPWRRSSTSTAARSAAAGAAFPGGVPDGAGFMVIAEADGTAAEAERLQRRAVEVLGRGALGLQAPVQPARGGGAVAVA